MGLIAIYFDGKEWITSKPNHICPFTVEENEFMASFSKDHNMCEDSIYFSVNENNAKIRADELNQAMRDGSASVIRCKSCNNFLLQYEEEKRWYINKGLNPPKRCSSCRKNKRK